MKKTLIWFIFLSFFSLLTAQAQNDCGIADSIQYPVDTTVFSLAQDYGVPSPRHQGRYHTGEDWHGGRGSTFGQPIRAAARGMVMLSSPNAWGRDGGVIILRHNFADGSTVFTQYGHITQDETVQFPQPLTCVEAGEVIAVIGDSRPAPHLHFEVRVANGDTPGPGYSWASPDNLGWRDPSNFITNMQSRLNPASAWNITLNNPEIGLITPPLVLDDNSLLYFDQNTIRRATSDGRIMWRLTLPQAAVGITGFQGFPLATYADGTMQIIAIEGSLGESWRTNESLTGFPLVANDLILFPTDDQAIVALDRERRNVAWRTENVPPPVRWHQADNGIIGIMTQTDEIITLSPEGQMLDRATLRELGSLATGFDGSLLIYSRGGLWQVDPTGTWSVFLEDAPAGGYQGGIVTTAEGTLVLFDGETLYSYSQDKALLWQEPINDVEGKVELADYGNALLLISGTGDVVVINKSGGACNRIQIAGDDRARLWHNLGSDGILRVAIGDQLLGLDWGQLTRVC